MLQFILEFIATILHLVYLAFQAISVMLAIAYAGFIIFAIAMMPVLVYAQIRTKLQDRRDRLTAETRKRGQLAMARIRVSGELCPPQLRKTGQ
jgi:hypothetical protein